MAEIPGSVRLTGFIAPTDSTDTYPVTHDTYNKGGYRTVTSIAERDAITTERRSIGMMVYVDAEAKAYVLGGSDVADNNGWQEFAPGLDLAGNVGDIQIRGANDQLGSLEIATGGSAASGSKVLVVNSGGVSVGSLLAIDENGQIVEGSGLSVAGSIGDIQINNGSGGLGYVSTAVTGDASNAGTLLLVGTSGVTAGSLLSVDSSGKIVEGTRASFTVAADSGSSATINDNQTLTIKGHSSGISTSVNLSTDEVTVKLDNTTVGAGSYTNANITVDEQGRITSASSGASVDVGDGLSVAGYQGDFQFNYAGHQLGADRGGAHLRIKNQDPDDESWNTNTYYSRIEYLTDDKDAVFEIQSPKSANLYLNADGDNTSNKEHQNATIVLSQDGERVFGGIGLTGDTDKAPSFVHHNEIPAGGADTTGLDQVYSYTGTIENSLLLHGSHGLCLGVANDGNAKAGFGKYAENEDGDAKSSVRMRMATDGNIELIPETTYNAVKIQASSPAYGNQTPDPLYLGTHRPGGAAAHDGSLFHSSVTARLNAPTSDGNGDLLAVVGGAGRSLTYEGELPVQGGIYPFAKITVDENKKISEIVPNTHDVKRIHLDTTDGVNLNSVDGWVTGAKTLSNNQIVFDPNYGPNPYFSQYVVGFGPNHTSISQLGDFASSLVTSGNFPYGPAAVYENKVLNAFSKVELPDPAELPEGTRITITFAVPDLTCMAIANQFPASSGGAVVPFTWTNNSYLYRSSIGLFITGPEVTSGPEVDIHSGHFDNTLMDATGNPDAAGAQAGEIISELILLNSIHGDVLNNRYHPSHYVNGGLFDWIMQGFHAYWANGANAKSNEDGRNIYTTGPMLLPGDSMTFTVTRNFSLENWSTTTTIEGVKVWQITESHLMAGYQNQYHLTNVDKGLHDIVVGHNSHSH